jgi:hypothetical protein
MHRVLGRDDRPVGGGKYEGRTFEMSRGFAYRASQSMTAQPHGLVAQRAAWTLKWPQREGSKASLNARLSVGEGMLVLLNLSAERGEREVCGHVGR